jgi:drug/metabolite transporter (DMT)-like permease
MFLFVCLDANSKYLTQTLPVPQVVWARFMFHFVLIALILRQRLPASVRSNAPWLQFIRSILLASTTALFVWALSLIQLAEASTIMFMSPILLTALAGPVLGEQVGLRRWLGVAAGFTGAMIIIRPGMGVFALAALPPLAAALTNALYQLTTRKVADADAPIVSITLMPLFGAIVTSIIVPFFWQEPTAWEWFLLVCMGMFGAVSHYCLIRAFDAAPASAVAPFGYTTLIWAVIIGFVLFDELPDIWTFGGAGVIIASGLYIFHRERVRKGQTAK